MHTKIRVTASAVAALLFVVAIAAPDWIETTSAVDPDQHNGMLEKALSAAGLLVVLILALWPAIQRLRHRRLRNLRTAVERTQGANQTP